MCYQKLLPVKIGGVKVLPFKSKNQLLHSVFSAKGEITPGMAVAVNPEKVLMAMEDQETRDIINAAEFPYADGIGVVKALERKTGVKLIRIAGCELWLDILRHSVPFQSRVVIIGAKPEVNIKTKELLLKNEINIVGALHGYYETEQEVFDLILSVEPNIVIIALGSPKQEKLIKKLLVQRPNAFYMGVGGSFDVLTGNVKRAPTTWQNLHLEWLYRMLKEPKRFFRQIKLLKFAYLYLFNKL
jgi:UDP-N-acetyl-D-mannosaminouronate:lipid I N-acetyl-D-mannosaminouronosyltransferase